MKKPVQNTTHTGKDVASIDGLVDVAPTLCEFLVSSAYDGDVAGTRQTSTLLIFAQDGSWKACLRDRQEQRCMWVAASVFNDLISVLEDALANGSGIWRDDRASGHDVAKRQKKGQQG